MIITLCDTCGKKIQPGELPAEFNSLETDWKLLKKGAPPKVSKYLLCNSCGSIIKKAIAQLIADKKNEQK